MKSQDLVVETGSGSEADLAGVLDRLLPAQDVYRLSFVRG